MVMTGLYFFAILVGILVALTTKKLAFRGEPVPFVLELPNYRMPSAKSVMRLIWDKTKDFLHRAFGIIFIATIVVWFLQSFDFGLNFIHDQQQSILAAISSGIAPIFAPFGCDDWRIVSSVICGFMAKESVVATLTVLFGSTAAVHSALVTTSALALLVFCLLYTPCVATIATVKREVGGIYAFGLIFWQTAIAWICAFCVYGLANMFLS